MKSSILLRLGRYPEALESSVHAMVVRHPSPSSAAVACDICRVAGIQEVPAEVVAAVEESGDAGPLVAYARLVFARGDSGQAAELLARREPSAIGEAGRALLLRCHLVHGNIDLAEAMTSACDEPERSMLGAEISAHKGDWRGAVDSLETAVCVRPADRAILVSLARAYIGLSRPEAAVAAADAAIGVDPLDWEPHEIKADVYRSMGMSRQAESERVHAETLMMRCGGRTRREGGA